MIVARRFVAERRRGLRWWLIGIVALVAFTVSFFPSVRGQASFEEVYEELPAAMRAMLGATEGLGITTAPGYLQGRLFGSLLPVVLLVLAITTATRATAGAEEDGTLEQLVILPVTRTRLHLERVAATFLITIVAGAVALVALLVLGPPFGATDGVATGDLVAAVTGATALAAFHGAVALGVGAATGRRALTSASATTLAVAGFLAQGLLAASDASDWTRWSSPWHWYLGEPAVVSGFAWPMLVLPTVGALASVGVGLHRFQRRDLR